MLNHTIVGGGFRCGIGDVQSRQHQLFRAREPGPLRARCGASSGRVLACAGLCVLCARVSVRGTSVPRGRCEGQSQGMVQYHTQQYTCGGGSMLQCRLYVKVTTIAFRVIDRLCPRALPTQVTRSLLEMGCYSVSLGDTIGAGTPGSTLRLVQHLRAEGLPVNKLAAHFHDTYGQALANILVALEEVPYVFGRASATAVCHSTGEIGVRVSTLPNCRIRVYSSACWCLLCTVVAERRCTIYTYNQFLEK